MKKLVNKVLASTANAALEAVVASAGIPSYGGTYQPKELDKMQKLASECKKESK